MHHGWPCDARPVPQRGDQPMTSPHSDPETHGHRFGAVVVTIDLEAFDCVVRGPRPGKGLRNGSQGETRFHALDEIQAAWRTQNWLSRKPEQHPHAADMVRALKFAEAQLRAHQRQAMKARG